MRWFGTVLLCCCCCAFSSKGFAGGWKDTTVVGPYHFSWKRASVIGGSGLLLSGTGLGLSTIKRSPTAEEVLLLDRNDVPTFDRPAVDQNDHSFDLVSDVLLYSGGGFALLHTIKSSSNKRQFFWLGTMFTESLAYSFGVNYTVKNLVDRPRPFLYNQSLTVEERLAKGSENLRSFYSGHTTVTFCTGVFIAKTYSDLHPHSKARKWIWAGAILGAGATGFSRYRAGLHFPSDVLLGAITGSFFGYIVPELHKRPLTQNLSFAPYVDPFSGGNGIHLTYRW